MATRSRKGCIDCKQAKIKCDEVRPACGTCARRSRTCRGYLDAGRTKHKRASVAAAASAASLQPLAPMPCAVSSALQPLAMPCEASASLQPTPLPCAPQGEAVHSSSSSSPHSSHQRPYPSQPNMSPQEPLPAHLMPMGQLDHSLAFPSVPSTQLLQHQHLEQLPTMMPFGLGTPPVVPTNATDDMSWAPPNWPARIGTFPEVYPSLGFSLVVNHPPATLVTTRPLPTPTPVRGPSFMPLSEIRPEDRPYIELYFARHPAEMVMSSRVFIDEMNGMVLSLLQVNPVVVSESLCAIGANYMQPSDNENDKDIVSVRTTALHNRLRQLNEDGARPELVLLLLLALCGAELTNPQSDGKGGKLAALIDNVAVVLESHSPRQLSTTSQYFAKGVARQDLLQALSRMQRPRIEPSTWLDEYASRHADRLLGLTATLTPILYRLAELAGDVQAFVAVDVFEEDVDLKNVFEEDVGQNVYPDGVNVHPNGLDATHALPSLATREAALRAQLLMWRPIHDDSLSLQTSRTLLMHASAWRAAALLYLFRIFYRPGSTPDADRTALGMAYEVMMHIHGPAEDIKLSLWPLFVAACELQQAEDRSLATALFDEVCRARPIMTARRTQAFVTEHIWPARDRGDVWDWMQLSASFIPL